MFGLVNLSKPAGITSRQAVDAIQALAGRVRAGHAGTLDPMATGVLVVALGPATRLIPYIQRMPKQYRAGFLLGRTSDTEDCEGTVRELPSAAVPTAEQVLAALPHFQGQILQTPPAYSALKLRGRRAYQLARQGAPVQLAPRPITIHRLTLVKYDYPLLELEIRCSGGTYVRTLGRDIARSLGSDTVMASLVRHAVGPFRLDQAVSLDELRSRGVAACRIVPEAAVADLPKRTLDPSELERIRRGQAIDSPDPAPQEVAAFDPAGRLVAILVPRGPGRLGPAKNFG